jgi:hypothetical protein
LEAEKPCPFEKLMGDDSRTKTFYFVEFNLDLEAVKKTLHLKTLEDISEPNKVFPFEFFILLNIEPRFKYAG